jgi:hypothetical protein
MKRMRLRGSRPRAAYCSAISRTLAVPEPLSLMPGPRLDGIQVRAHDDGASGVARGLRDHVVRGALLGDAVGLHGEPQPALGGVREQRVGDGLVGDEQRLVGRDRSSQREAARDASPVVGDQDARGTGGERGLDLLPGGTAAARTAKDLGDGETRLSVDSSRVNVNWNAWRRGV